MVGVFGCGVQGRTNVEALNVLFPLKRIMAYDVGVDGLPNNEREFAKTNVDDNGNTIPGISNGPDGMTVDKEGYVWTAQWGSHAVVRYTPHPVEIANLAR